MTGEVDPISVQIAGADPAMMAQAAKYNADNGAQIIDINMGCPAKKVCNVMAGSALMQNEPLVAKILEAVVKAVPDTPVTLKFRTGWNRDNRNAPGIARIAEESGIRAIAIHGRTRADQYTGERRIRHHRPGQVPGEDSGDRQRRHRHAAKGPLRSRLHRRRRRHDRPRGAGAPLAARDRHFLATGEELAAPRAEEIHAILRGHLAELYGFYGEETGVRIARKHISWYTKGLSGAAHFRHAMNQLQTVREQLDAADEFSASVTER
jgi:tRNA-dihydrouridine synthase B